MTMSAQLDGIAGLAHPPTGTPAGVVLLTHGAGGSRESPLLIRICQEWADRGWLERLVTRRVPIGDFADALDRRDGDVKVVLDIAR